MLKAQTFFQCHVALMVRAFFFFFFNPWHISPNCQELGPEIQLEVKYVEELFVCEIEKDGGVHSQFKQGKV